MVVAILSVLSACSNPPQNALLSLNEFRLPAGERLAGLQIETRGVTVLALCHKPLGWVVGYGNGALGGFLGAESKSTETDLDLNGLTELRRLFLIATSRDHSLSGIVRLRSQRTGTMRDVSLRPLNFISEPAENCD